jgi:DNA polymerase
LESILKDISQYFEFLKESGQERFNVSDKSKTAINEWGITFEGHINSSVYIVDSKSVFFSGPAGKLLVKILQAMKLSNESVCICNAFSSEILKSRIKRVKPEVVITLGKESADLVLKNMTSSGSPLKFFRGRFHEFYGIKVMPTWHPLSLIIDETKKRDVWEDMKIVMKHLGL